MKRFNRSNDRFTKWGDARVSFKSLTTLSELATRFIHENHPLFAQATVCSTSKTSLVSNASSEKLAEPEEPLTRKGRQRKSNRFYEDYEQDPTVIIQKKRIFLEPEVFPDDGQRRKRNVGIPRHFENMVMIEQKRKRVDPREEEDTGSVNTFDNDNDQVKRKRGRPQKSRDNVEGVEEPSYNTATHAELMHQQQQSVRAAAAACGASRVEVIMAAPKRLTFPEFCDQMADFFRVLGAWYGVAAPIILHYLREQILPVLRVLSATQLPRATIEQLFDQISRTLSYRGIAPSFLSLLSIGRGFPFYAALVHTLRIYDPENLYGMRSMHYFVEPPPIQVITIYLRKVVEALNQPDGREVFRRVATLMDEVVTEWKDYSIPLEKRLEKIVKIDQMLPEHCRGLRARLYHVLMLPTTIMSKTLLQQQQLDESHVISTADGMIGTAEAKRLERLGYDSLRETGIVPSGAPNTVLFNNVAYIKPVTVHPGLQSAVSLSVPHRMEPPMPVVNRMYASYPEVASGPMFYVTGAGSFSTSFSSVPVATSAATALAPNVYAGHSSNSQVRGPPYTVPTQSNQFNGAPYPHTGVYSNGQQVHSNGNIQMAQGNMQPSVAGSAQAGTSSGSAQSGPHPNETAQTQHEPQLNGTAVYPHTVNGGAAGVAYNGGSTYVLNNNYMTLNNGPTTQPVRRYTYIPVNEFDASYAQYIAMRRTSSNNMFTQSNQPTAEKTAVSKSDTTSSNSSSVLPAAVAPSSSSSSSDVAVRLQALSTGLADTSQKREEAAVTEKRFSDEASRVKLFLEKASGVVAEKFIGPFLLAVRELVRRLRAGETAKDDLDARIYLLHSFVPPGNTEFRDEISSIFTPQNITPLPGRPFMNPAGVVPFPVGAAEIRDVTGVNTSGMVTTASVSDVVSSSAGDVTAEQGSAESEHASEGNTAVPDTSTDSQSAGAGSSSMPKLPSIREMAVHTTSGLPDCGLLRRHMDTTATTVGPVLYDSSHSGTPAVTGASSVLQPPVSAAPAQSSSGQPQQPLQQQPASQKSQPQHKTGQKSQLLQQQQEQKAHPLKHQPGHPMQPLQSYPGQQSLPQQLQPGQQQQQTAYPTAAYRYQPAPLPLSSTQGLDNQLYQPPAPLPLSMLQMPAQQSPLPMQNSSNLQIPLRATSFAPMAAPDSSEPPPLQLTHAPAGSSAFPLTNGSVPALNADTALQHEPTLSAVQSLHPQSASTAITAAVPSTNTPLSRKEKGDKRGSLHAASNLTSTTPLQSLPSTDITISAAAVVPVPSAVPVATSEIPKKGRRNSGQGRSGAHNADTAANPQTPAVPGGLPEEIRVHPTKPVIINGVTFPYVAPFPAPVEAVQDSGITNLLPTHVFTSHNAESNQGIRNGQKASLAAGPMIIGEDKQLQLRKALAYYFDLQGTNYELSITVLSEKFRVSQGKIKSALSQEVEQRIANWSDKLCARLDEVLETFKKESAMSLARAAEAHCVPYIFALIWFIKGKASVNRHRTKPEDFKMKLREMFIAYFKAEEGGNPASRAAIARRFELAPAVFSRKLVDLTEEQRQEYIETARQLLEEERSGGTSKVDSTVSRLPVSVSTDSVLQVGKDTP